MSNKESLIRHGVRSKMEHTFYSQPEGLISACGQWKKNATDKELTKLAGELGYPDWDPKGKQKITGE